MVPRGNGRSLGQRSLISRVIGGWSGGQLLLELGEFLEVLGEVVVGGAAAVVRVELGHLLVGRLVDHAPRELEPFLH